MIFTADHEAGLETEIVSEGRPQAVRTANRIARANRRINTANIDAALGTVEKRGSGELVLGTPHADRETREAQRQTVRELSENPGNVSAERCANRLFDLTSKEKKATMKQPTYKMERIALADCKPHADAEAYSASSEDRAALSNSINESGLLSPIAVIVDDSLELGAKSLEGGKAQSSKLKAKSYYVIDGIGRLNALMAAGVTETDAQVFDLGDLSVAEFVVCKNAMMRKVTTGTRVMAYLKCHEREVLAAADPKKYNFRETSFKGKRGAVSHETAPDKGWSSKDIAERIGVSKQDVLAGIELLKATAESGEDGGACRRDGGSTGPKYEQMDLFETAEAVLRGETPIRRWKAAAGGKVSKVGGKAAADYSNIGMRTMGSLAQLFACWQSVPMANRALIVDRWIMALAMIPEDFIPSVKAVVSDECEAKAAKRGKRK